MLELANKKIVAYIVVSVDGTWQRLGHSSRIRVVFILSVNTIERGFEVSTYLGLYHIYKFHFMSDM